MPSDSHSADARLDGRGVLALLGSGFGFLVWGTHFLVIYIAEAVTCQLSAVSVMSPGAAVIAVLATVTALAAVAVLAHAWRLWQHRRGEGEDRFIVRIAIGQDSIATVAILWQLIPLFMVPLCR